MKQVFTYRSWFNVGCGWLVATLALALLGAVLYHVIWKVPWIMESEATGERYPAEPWDFSMLVGVGFIGLIAGIAQLMIAYRAEVVVEPLGIAAYGLGIRPKFFAGWNEITEIEMISTESRSCMRLRAGRRKVDLPTSIANWSELRSIIEARVSPNARRN